MILLWGINLQGGSLANPASELKTKFLSIFLGTDWGLAQHKIHIILLLLDCIYKILTFSSKMWHSSHKNVYPGQNKVSKEFFDSIVKLCSSLQFISYIKHVEILLVNCFILFLYKKEKMGQRVGMVMQQQQKLITWADLTLHTFVPFKNCGEIYSNEVFWTIFYAKIV